MFEWNADATAADNMARLEAHETARVSQIPDVLATMNEPTHVYAELRSALERCHEDPLWIDWVVLLYLALPRMYREPAWALMRSRLAGVEVTPTMTLWDVVDWVTQMISTGHVTWEGECVSMCWRALGYGVIDDPLPVHDVRDLNMAMALTAWWWVARIRRAGMELRVHKGSCGDQRTLWAHPDTDKHLVITRRAVYSGALPGVLVFWGLTSARLWENVTAITLPFAEATRGRIPYCQVSQT